MTEVAAHGNVTRMRRRKIRYAGGALQKAELQSMAGWACSGAGLAIA